MADKTFLSIKEAAEYLGVEYKTVYRLIKGARLPAGKIGGVYRIKQEDIDAYFERQKREVVARRAAEAFAPGPAAPGDVLHCGRCLKLLSGVSAVAGRCTAPSCQAVLCPDCWRDQDGEGKFCAEHAPGTQSRLEAARRALEAGEVSRVVSSEEAKRRELTFIGRFERKIHEITTIRSPFDDRIYTVASWDAYHETSNEVAAILDILGTGYLDRRLEKSIPLNLKSRYEVPAQASGRERRAPTGLTLEASVFSHLRAQATRRFDTEPASLAELVDLLQDYARLAERQSRGYIVGVASTSGWAAEALDYVRADPEGQSFSHRLVLPFAIDLHDDLVVYDELDERLRAFASVFSLKRREEEVQQAITYIGEALAVVHDTLTPAQVREHVPVDHDAILEAFSKLEETGQYVVHQFPDVGTVISSKR